MSRLSSGDVDPNPDAGAVILPNPGGSDTLETDPDDEGDDEDQEDDDDDFSHDDEPAEEDEAEADSEDAPTSRRIVADVGWGGPE